MTETMLQWLASIGRSPKIESQSEVDAEGYVELVLRFELVEEARGYIMSVGPGIEILEPLKLRQEIIELARSVLAFYTEHTPTLPITASTGE